MPCIGSPLLRDAIYKENERTMTQPIRVLIADDNIRSRNGLRALLATIRLNSLKTGADGEAWPEIVVVGEAADGRKAVHQVAECLPDVVLMDARMPEMDGLEATRLIKQRWPGVKVVVLTIYTTYRAKALAAGADVFLVKGCSNEELLAAILKL
jgi:DNA-binding NarL/FixJ family response regulator